MIFMRFIILKKLQISYFFPQKHASVMIVEISKFLDVINVSCDRSVKEPDFLKDF